VQEIARLERADPLSIGSVGRTALQGASRRPNRDSEADARIGELLESLQPRGELPPKSTPDDGGRNMKLADQDLTVQLLGSERPEKRPSQDVFVRRRLAAQDFRERRRRGVELNGDNETARHMDAVNAPAILDELESPGGLASMKSTEKIAETSRTEPARKEHCCEALSGKSTAIGHFPAKASLAAGRREGDKGLCSPNMTPRLRSSGSSGSNLARSAR
jgi:hypothetical protein